MQFPKQKRKTPINKMMINILLKSVVHVLKETPPDVSVQSAYDELRIFQSKIKSWLKQKYKIVNNKNLISFILTKCWFTTLQYQMVLGFILERFFKLKWFIEQSLQMLHENDITTWEWIFESSNLRITSWE